MSRLPKKWLVVVSVLFGTFTVILNNSMLNPTLPRFIKIFNSDAVSVGWMLTIFMVAMGMTMPLTGFLGDRFGKKKVYISGLIIFMVGSISGSLSPSLGLVILSRAIQGIAGGLMMPIAMALIFNAFPKNERGLAVGIYGVAAMVAPAIGPTVGGVIIQYFAWPFLFLFNIPFGIIGIILSTKFLKETETNPELKFDYIGFVLVTAGVGSVLYALGRGKTLEALTQWSNIALIVGGIVAIIAFVRFEDKQQQPLLNLSVFKVPTYAISTIVTGSASIGLFSGIFLLPLLIQEVYGLSEVLTGLLFLPAAAASGIFMSVGGRILDKKGPKWVIPIGLLILASATTGLGFIGLSTPYWVILALNAVRGMGLGFSNMPATTAGMNAIPEHLVAQGSAMNNVLRQIASSLGIVFFSVYYETRRVQIAAGQPNMTEATLQTLNEAFLVSTALVLIALPFSFFMKGVQDDEEDAKEAQ
ncbi:DHA2 family efflux MFS transporter permease subunit [Pontibacillus yanchengensis]|uniref:DHA2 family efflux MFS transporter permease subunit n=2 Tax=Pontibacillus yanchengensis TaxID=462910 RepID=A0ACC7VM96_9BACI|nr:MDR family MFS transporter [Pontibacillus yanchengensis]MYL35741.1 DHA2 family efflux MFS transporter permease subunit [Pontibacillus yanchengensis]MYL55450.1 DHA2 family efflux MFS transporter permease subunit [Pontibacillus yanchengensis]